MPQIIIRLEGLIFLIISVLFYFLLDGNWLLFLLLLFVPDISMIGYLRNKKLGALTYNLVHNYVIGLVLVAIGIFLFNDFILSAGVVLFSHTALDRFLGFGLKYPKSFKDTHIQRV